MDHNGIAAWLKRRRVAVLKGGWSRERPISLKSGLAVENSFRRMGIPVHSIDVNPKLIDRLKSKKIQFCFIALHGEFGEDGGVQALLEFLRIPYTGSGPLASGIAMNKILSKQLFDQSGVPTPKWQVIKAPAKVGSLSQMSMKYPVFVKPFDQGSAIGVSRVTAPRQMPAALKNCFSLSQRALVEEFIAGRELTVGILGDQLLPVVEIIPKHAFYDFHSKYAAGGSRHLVPADLSDKQLRQVQQAALGAFHALGCEVYGRVDVLLKRGGGPMVLEVNTIPGMTETSLLPDAAKAQGMDFDQLVLRICALSVERSLP